MTNVISRRKLSPLSVLPIALISFCQLAGAATYYVATNGSDSNPGTLAAPFRNLQRGASQAIAGDTVIVRDGTYGHVNSVTGGDSADNSMTPVLLYNSGNASAWITLKAENKGKAILDCEMICDAYINLLSASYIVIQDFVITRGYKEGIHSNDAAHHITLRGNRFEYIANRTTSTNLGLDGLYTNANCHDFIIDGNVFHDIGRSNYQWLDHGLYLHGYNYTIINNIFYNNTRGWAIQMANGLSNVLIANNTFAFPGAQDGHIMMWDTQSNLTVRNNVFYNPTSYAFSRYTSSVSSCTIDHNIVYGAYGVMADSSGCSVSANQVGANPMFVNVSGFDFHVQSGAPGIDSGVNIATVPVDMDGKIRPQGASTDIGAYEYQAATATPPVIAGVFASGISSNSAFISWSTNVPATSSAQYGLSSYTNATPTDATLLIQHTVQLSNLTASTVYHFRVASQNSTGQLAYSSDYTFTTAAPLAPPPPSSTVMSLSASAPSLSVTSGQQASSGITAALVSGTAGSVTFSTSALPAGVTAAFSSSSCTITCSTTLTFSTTTSAPAGSYSIVVSGTGSGTSASTTLALTIAAAPSLPTGDVTSGLAAWWTFNEALTRNGNGPSASDSSGNGNTGTLKSAKWVTGPYGSAVQFSGSGSYVSVKESGTLQMTQQLTVSFWLYANSNSNVDPRVISKAYSWDVKLNGSNRNPQFSAGGNYAMMNYSLPLNKWQQVTFTFSQGVVNGYVNGVPVSFAANTFSSPSLPSYPYGLFIGTDAGLAASFAGLADDVRLYNRALSAAEVSAVYSNTLH